MIDPDRYYTREDKPTASEKEEVWSLLRQSNRTVAMRPFMLIRDRGSFLFGAAAMIILFLVSAGAWTIYQNILDTSRSPEARLDRAYQNALVEFDHAMPVVLVSSVETQPGSGLLVMRKRQLQILDESIENARSQLGLQPGNTVLKVQLLQLYNLKLQFQLQMSLPPSATVSR